MAGKGKKKYWCYLVKGTDEEFPPFVWTGDRIMGYIEPKLIQGLTHNLPKRVPLYCWIPAAISKIQTGMIMTSLSGFSILAGTICKETLHETCYLI